MSVSISKKSIFPKIVFGSFFFGCLLLWNAVTFAAQPASSSQPSWYADHDRAVQLAREGRYAESLDILRHLYAWHRDDRGVVRDYLTVLGWAGGNDSQVIGLYKMMADPNQPDYVLEAVGLAYRNLYQPYDALGIYQLGLSHSPNNVAFSVGVIRSMAECGYLEKALKQAEYDLRLHGNRLEVLLAAGDVADKFSQIYQAFRYYVLAVQLEPKNKDALLGLIRSADRVGAPKLSLKLIEDNPGLVGAAEYRRIEGDETATLVRWGTLDPASEARRYATTDEAITKLQNYISRWSKGGALAQDDVHRAQLDLVVALSNRSRMEDVIELYKTLLDEKVEIPNYVLSPIADAYLYLRHPEKARDLYLKILETEPKNFGVRRQLFYAYIECDDYDNAFQVIDDLVKDQPIWAPQTGAPNISRYSAELAAGSARLFAGEVQEANKRIEPLANAAPNNPSSREALGNLYAAHGWPREAIEQYEIGLALERAPDVGNEVDAAETNLNLQNFQLTEAATQDLTQREPENLAVQRLDRDWQVHNMAELRVRAGYDFSPITSVNVTGGEAYGIDTVLYSPPIDYNWRIFAGEYYTHQVEPDKEGSVGYSRTTAGIEYRNGPITAEAAPTYNLYHNTDRAGGEADATWSINDQWTVAGSGELFSRDTPLRALNAGVTADAYNAHAVWRESEIQELRFGGDIMPFSDGNLRSGVDADYSHRLFTYPHLVIDGLVDAGESQNSDNANRLYYNPYHDFIALAGARAVQTLYQRYSTLYQQSLTLTPGAYWQQFYGDSAAFRLRYEQRVFFNNVFEAGLGVDFERQAYDGNPEDDIGLTFDLTERF